jgi:endonuclease G
VVGLHHAGLPRKDAQGRWLLKDGTPAGDDDDDADVDWIANQGVRASRVATTALSLAPAGPLRSGLEAACLGRIAPSVKSEPDRMDAEERRDTPVSVSHPAPNATTTPGEMTIPLIVTLRLGAAGSATAAAPAEAPERNVEPWHDPDYTGRQGYRPDFLGVEVPLPELMEPEVATPRIDGEGVLVPYEHFTLVLHRVRRLPIFTAANVDFSPAAKEPEPGFVYSRRGLGELGEKDREKWFLDPRLPAASQLPERFFNNDRQSFDKGHLVRREEVCWGVDHAQVRRANGDTYHVTNCTPQVAGFNQSKFDGLWGELENEIEAQGETERYCLFAGPLLAEDDPVFVGVDSSGPVSVRIPRAYWKVIVARDGAGLAAFGFLLEQDLTKVAFEFDPGARWRRHMVPLNTLQTRIGLVRFPKAVLKADRFAAV